MGNFAQEESCCFVTLHVQRVTRVSHDPIFKSSDRLDTVEALRGTSNFAGVKLLNLLHLLQFKRCNQLRTGAKEA